MILYINTSSDFCETALFDKEKCILQKLDTEKLQHSQVLHAQIQELLHQGGIDYPQIKHVAVMNGPGSYTGLRIGLATAKSICYACQIPLLLLNKLEVLSHLAYNIQSAPVLCILPARQDEFFAHYYCPTRNISESKILFIEELNEEIKRKEYKICTLTNVNIAPEMNPLFASISLQTIQDELEIMIDNQQFSNLFEAEPFYIKTVHVNKSKPKF